MGQSSQPHELGGGLKSRHVTMLSIAGVIGASLFVGSSVAIAEAGPAVLLAYYADVGGNGGCHARYRFVFHLCR